MCFASVELEDISIPPPNVKMTKPLATIVYLSSSMRSLVENPSGAFPYVFTEPPSEITLVSTSTDISSTSFPSSVSSDVYVNHISHDAASGSPVVSCGLYFASTPIFHSDEDIMEEMTTPDFPWDDMHHHAYFLPQQTLTNMLWNL